MRQSLALLSAFFALIIPSPVSADTATLTSGTVSLSWDGSLSGFSFSGPGTDLIGEVLQSPTPFFLTAGTRSDLNNTIRANESFPSNHPFSERVNGTIYSVFISASFTFTTQPMVVPFAIEGATASFSTPLTIAGTISGYSDKERTNQVFSLNVQGTGVATAAGMKFHGGTWAYLGSGAELYTMTGPLPHEWTATDVGSVGIAGISSSSGGNFFVAGAGDNIWGAADAFQFVSQPLPADGSIVARMNLEQMTSPYAKAGVMIRQTTDAGSAHVVLDVKPDGGIEFMTRAAPGGSTTFLSGAMVTSSPWLKLSRTGSTVTASVSTDGSTWTVLGSAPLSGSALVGLAVTSQDATVLNQASFDQVTVVAAAAGGSLPTSWSDADVGAVGLAGSASASSGTFTVNGAGDNIWGVADGFNYVWTPMNSNGSIEARVVGENAANTFAKAGVMFRQSLDESAVHVVLDVRPNGFIEFMTRSTAGGPTTYIGGVQSSFPVSLKLTRMDAGVNSTFTAFVSDASTDGWQQVGAVQIAMGPNATAGLVVTNQDTSGLNTATFDSVAAFSAASIDADIGDVGVAGGAVVSGGDTRVSGGGADIWGTADAFNFDYTSLVNDGGMYARVTGMDNTSPFAKAGIMIRASTDPSAAHVILDVKPDGGIEFMTRPAAGGTTTFLAGATRSFPILLYLVRSGTTVNAYVVDGSQNTPIGSASIDLPSDALIGLAVTSHERGTLTTATFDQISR